MSAYYNEHDAKKAAWLRELIRRDLIAPGVVDERSIEIVQPGELREFNQCHFFAGIGVWSYALRNAGWSDNAPVWTGSCPCPSFSQSGKGEGFDDPRHLWPAWFRLLRVCRPDVVFGEQVASDSALAWLDLVSSDLEGEGYAIGAADLCAAGVGAPHIRQRLYFVAHTNGEQKLPATAGRLYTQPSECRTTSVLADAGSAECQAWSGDRLRAERTPTEQVEAARCCSTHPLEHPPSNGLPRRGRHGAPDLLGDSESERCGEAGRGSGRPEERAGDASEPSELGHAEGNRREQCITHGSGGGERIGAEGIDRRATESGAACWSDIEWLPCRDGKARPVESGTFPLAHGAPERVVRLRGYGDAIVAPLAQAFIEAYQQVRAA